MSRRMLALAACWVLVNLASVTHTAWSFAQLERPGWWWLVGVVAAVGTDAGMAALTWLAMERRREQRPFGWAVLGVLIAGGAVAYANVDHALGVVGTWATLSWWVRSRVLVLSLILPSLTVLMSALVEHEHASGHAEPEGTRVSDAVDLVLKLAREQMPAQDVAPTAGPPTPADADRLALVLDHVAAHGPSADVDIATATGVPRSTVGRWRRDGLLAVPTGARNGSAPAHTMEG